MQRSLMLFGIVVIGSVLIQLLTVALYKWRNTWRYRGKVVATIEQIQIWLDGWYVTAVWTDVLTNQSYTFYSHRIEFDLKQRVGDSVVVAVDPNNLKRYRIDLWGS